jgi:hypothetical protein
MSYRNPPIIVDRSGDIWAQTIANFGQQVAAGITTYGEARKAEIEATRKNQQAMQSLEVQIREKYTDSAREHYLALKKQGDDTIAEQFKQDMARYLDGVGVPGEEGYKMGAIDARVQLQLGRDLTTEQRKEYQKIVDDAKNYQTEMVDGFGKVISGMDYVKGKKATDLGTPGGYIFKGKNNLERFNNQLAYHALNTDSMISPNTIESRKMERGENGENFLITKTLIPVDEMKSGALSKTLTPQELEGVNIVEQDGKQYYQFDFKKDTNIWDGEFVDDVDKLPDYSKAYNIAQIEDDKGNTTASYSANVTRVDGKTRLNEDIVNLKEIEKNVSLYGEMMANAKAVLQGSPEEIEAFLQFGTNRATLTYDSFIEQVGTDFNSQQKFIADALIQNSIETKFSQYKTRKATEADVTKLKESNPDTTIKEGDDIKYKVLKSQEIKEEKPTETKVDVSYIDDIEIPIGTGPAEEGGEFINVNALEMSIAPFGFRVSKSEVVDGRRARTVTKSVEGADRSVTIFDDMTPEEVKNLLKFIEVGGSFSTSKKETQDTGGLPILE